jgi:hypothetical protein
VGGAVTANCDITVNGGTTMTAGGSATSGAATPVSTTTVTNFVTVVVVERVRGHRHVRRVRCRLPARVGSRDASGRQRRRAVRRCKGRAGRRSEQRHWHVRIVR